MLATSARTGWTRPILFSALRRSAFRPRFLRHTHSRRNRGRTNGAVMLHEAGIFNARPFGFALKNRHRKLSMGIETTLQNSNRLASNWFRPTKPQASTSGRYSSVASERVSLSVLWAAMLNLSGPAAVCRQQRGRQRHPRHLGDLCGFGRRRGAHIGGRLARTSAGRSSCACAALRSDRLLFFAALAFG